MKKNFLKKLVTGVLAATLGVTALAADQPRLLIKVIRFIVH